MCVPVFYSIPPTHDNKRQLVDENLAAFRSLHRVNDDGLVRFPEVFNRLHQSFLLVDCRLSIQLALGQGNNGLALKQIIL